MKKSVSLAILGLSLAACSGGGSNTTNTSNTSTTTIISTPRFVPDQSVTVLEDDTVTVSLSGLLPDADTLFILLGPDNGSLSGGISALTYTPDPDFNGVDSATVRLQGSTIDSEPFDIDYDVSQVDDAPRNNGHPSSYDVEGFDYVSVGPSIENPDGLPLTTTAVNLPPWATVDSAAGRIVGTPTNAEIGVYPDIRMTVANSAGAFTTDPFTITVRSNPWSTLTPMPTGRHSPAAAISGSSVFIIGGFANRHLQLVEVYDIDSDTWQPGTPLQIGRSGHTAHVIGDQIFVVGGEDGNEIASVEAYSLPGDSWSTASSMSASRSYHAGCVFDGKIFVFGGFTEDGNPNASHTQSLATVEVYDPTGDTWSSRSPMQSENWGMTCVVFGNRIYLFGGAGNEDGYWIYHPDSDFWEDGGQLSNSLRYGFAGGLANGRIYLIGGYLTGSLDNTDELDPITSEWLQKSQMPVPRHNLGYVVHENRLYIFGGRNADSGNVSVVEVYEPGLEEN